MRSGLVRRRRGLQADGAQVRVPVGSRENLPKASSFVFSVEVRRVPPSEVVNAVTRPRSAEPPLPSSPLPPLGPWHPFFLFLLRRAYRRTHTTPHHTARTATTRLPPRNGRGVSVGRPLSCYFGLKSSRKAHSSLWCAVCATHCRKVCTTFNFVFCTCSC